MANVSSQPTRNSGGTSLYAGKDAVAISAVNAPANPAAFEKRLAAIRAAHGRDGVRAKTETDEDGKVLRDENGEPVVLRDSKGRIVYEGKHVQAYSLVESFGHDELDPDDPESWEKAQRYGRELAKEVAPGHPALVATEVNGRSGCVHNHIVIGATDPETGKQIDSNVFTHARLAIAHDRVLEREGFEQRADMKAIVQAAAKEMEERKQAVRDEEGFDQLSPSQQKRRLISAENSVRLQSQDGRDASLQREERRMREFERYRLNEHDRELTAEAGVTPPAQRFSEIELEARIKDALNDPRATSWEELSEVGREHGVTIDRRGKDVRYGMVLADSDGVLQEPARAHRRRGERLGEGFRVEDVEAALERNAELHSPDQARDPVAETYDLYDKLMANSAERFAEIDRTAEGVAQDELDRMRGKRIEQASEESREARELWEQAADTEQREQVEEPVAEQATAEGPAVQEPEPVAVEPEPEPAFGSRLRGVRAKSSSKKTQERIDAVAGLEEEYRDREPDARFEQRLNAAGGVGQRFLDHYGHHLDARMREQLELRLQARAVKETSLGFQSHAQMAERIDQGDYQGALDLHAEELRAMRQQAEQKAANRPAAGEAEPKAAQPEPQPRARRERQVGMLTGEQKKDAELIAVVRSEKEDGGAQVDFQLAADDPAAQGQAGLHLRAKRIERSDGRTTTGTGHRLTAEQYQRLQEAAGDSRTEVRGRQVLAFRGDVVTGIREGYTVNPDSMQPSRREPIGSDVLEKQRASEDRAREAKKTQEKPSERAAAADRADEAFKTARQREDSSRGLGE